ncbi:copper-binding protein [Variovorax sp. W6]|uniref:copper-binding protein n=1 Tax=Variovorax sp. W6 TaxID=3093895 RepID=UPI003D803BEC
MKVSHSLAFALFAASAAVAHAQMSKDEMSSMKMPAQGQPAQQAGAMMTDAVVQKIDTTKGLVVLKHGDIPNLAMPAMTMGFDVADRKMLDALKPGDKVRFHVEIVKGKPTVTQLETAR